MLRVLIVDDEPLARENLRILLDNARIWNYIDNPFLFILNSMLQGKCQGRIGFATTCGDGQCK